MNLDTSSAIEILSKSRTVEETRETLLNLGFNGLVFQRWYPDVMDNWEGYLAEGFLEHYYAAQLYKWCPVARAIHTWSRDYTFNEARRELRADHPNALRCENLYRQFGMDDGVVVFTGTNKLRSAVILTTSGSADRHLSLLGGVLAYGARVLTNQLTPGHRLLTQISRDDPGMSAIQNKILQMQIDHPEMSNHEMAEALGLSPKTLHSHHKKIAKKTGVTTFAGAVIKHMKETQ